MLIYSLFPLCSPTLTSSSASSLKVYFNSYSVLLFCNPICRACTDTSRKPECHTILLVPLTFTWRWDYRVLRARAARESLGKYEQWQKCHGANSNPRRFTMTRYVTPATATLRLFGFPTIVPALNSIVLHTVLYQALLTNRNQFTSSKVKV